MKFHQYHNGWLQMTDKNHGGIIDGDKTHVDFPNANLHLFFGDNNFPNFILIFAKPDKWI